MNNPLIGGQQPQAISMQMLQRLMQNPIQFLQRAGMNVPQGMNDPNAIIQHLMNTGQVSQQRYNQTVQMARQLIR